MLLSMGIAIAAVLVFDFPPTTVGEGILESNPFQRGCLFGLNPTKNRMRVCNSDDPPDAVKDGLCRTPEINYMEIRIFSHNWLSSVLESWILQAVLSEFLDVPTSIETGMPHGMNLYNPHGSFEYGGVGDTAALSNGAKLGDCRLASRDPENYETCAHIATEVWSVTSPVVHQMVRGGQLDPPQALGARGQEAWFVTKFTALNDTTLFSYAGMQGHANRRKLAETFKRPTTWGDYCDQVSPNGCSSDDGVARRPPQDESEYDRMYVEDMYIGHFRFTDKNDCDKYPTNCTGHIADYPCGWTSTVEAQAYHLDIALESDGIEPGAQGYSSSQMREMWHAANATRSNLIMYWWTPDTLYSTFLGTDAELQRVLLPVPTSECLEFRSTITDRCSHELGDRVGDPRGVCDDPPQLLNKLVTTSTYDSSHDSSIPEAIRSPAYDVLNLFTISDVHLSEILSFHRRYPDNPREAVCQWIDQRRDFIVEQFIPLSYPRSLKDTKDGFGNLDWVATVLACTSTLFVLWTGIVVFRHRESRVLVYAQVEFLWLLLAGSLIKSLGAIVSALPPKNASCVMAVWLVNVGYTFELVPLIVKTAAVNKLVNAAQSMRRVTMTRKSLFKAVFMISAIVVGFLVVWMILDAPHCNAEYQLTEEVEPNAMFGAFDEDAVGTCGNGDLGNGKCQDGSCCSAWGYCGDTEEHCVGDPKNFEIIGDTVVEVRYYCTSESNAWNFAVVGWNTLLLLCASILAFQARMTRPEFNESQTLAFMIYSHLMFVILRLSTFGLSGVVQESALGRIRSIIFSTDTIATLVIYFVPKFHTQRRRDSNAISDLGFRSSLRDIQPRYTIEAFAAMTKRYIISSVSFLLDQDAQDESPEDTNHAVVGPQGSLSVGPAQQFQRQSAAPSGSKSSSSRKQLPGRTAKCPNCGSVFEVQPFLSEASEVCEASEASCHSSTLSEGEETHGTTNDLASVKLSSASSCVSV